VQSIELELKFAELIRQLTDAQKRAVLVCLWTAQDIPPPPPPNEQRIVDTTGGKQTL